MPSGRMSGQRKRSASHPNVLDISLKPHHLPLLAILMWILHPHENIKLSQRYLLRVLNLLICELSEVAQPRSFQELITELKGGTSQEEYKILAEKIEELPRLLNSVHNLSGFLSDVPSLYQFDDDEPTEREPPIERRSLCGFFARRAVVAFRKLSLAGLAQVLNEFQLWSRGALPTASSSRASEKEKIRDGTQQCLDLLRSLVLIPMKHTRFERARANGDKQVASESLRRFFEQRFSEATDSDLRQHAMLNLARTHIFNGQIVAARKLLLEAITVSRTVGDTVVLQQCMALLRRIEGKSRTQREPLNELQHFIPAMEVLCDVGKLIREGVPLSDSFERLAQAQAVYDISCEMGLTPTPLEEQWAFHAMQSVLWRLAGSERLAIVEENIVLAFTEAGGNDDSRFTMLQNRASALARQGREAEGLSILLQPNTWKGLDISMTQFAYWSGEVWVTMLLYASRRSQYRQCHDFLMPRRPGSFNAYKDFFLLGLGWTNATQGIEGQLFRTLQLRNANQGWAAIDHILKAIWQAEYQGRFRLYRLAAVLLADAGLEFGMTSWSRRLMEEIMPQVISGDDLELRAFSCFVLARCIIACGKVDRAILRDALPYLQISEYDYRTLQIYRNVQDVAYVTALVYNSLGDTASRNAAATRHKEAQAAHARAEMIGLNDSWEELWDVVKSIAAALASRGRTVTS